MSRSHILDTGPLIALLNPRDRHHGWAIETWDGLSLPLLVCEPVVTEACFLARRLGSGAHSAILDLFRRGILDLSFRLGDEVTAVSRLLNKYQDVPMSLADACIVRMAELRAKSVVFTLDSDFAIYRLNSRQRIPTLTPEDQPRSERSH